MHLEHSLVSTERAEHAYGALDNVKVSLVGVASEDIHVKLPELAQATSLWALVAVHIGNREPFEWVVKLAHLCRNHAGYRWSHLGTDSKHSAAAVSKVVGLLLGDLLSAFGDIQLKRLYHRRVVFVKSRKLKCLAYLSEKPVAQLHVVGIKISCTLVRLGRKLFVAHFYSPFSFFFI